MLSQTEFGALIGIAQPTVSQWETQRRDDLLPPDLAERFLEVWRCFEMEPPRGFNDAIARLTAYRSGAAVPPSGPWVADEQRPSSTPHSWPIVLAQGPLPPRAILVETGPLIPVDPAAPMTRTFAAVERKESSSAAGPDAIATVSSATSTLPDARERTRPIFGSALSRHASIISRWGAAVSLVLLLNPTACFQAHNAASRIDTENITAEREQEPKPLPQQIYTDNAQEGSGGPAAKPRRSIPMPKKPYSWQKVAPCDPENGETEKVTGCWSEIKKGPPCPDFSVEDLDTGKCLVPVPAKPKSPSTVTPQK